MAKGIAPAVAFAVVLAHTVCEDTSLGQAPTPIGVEFHVNLFTPGAQTFPAVGMDASGNFVVVWVTDPDGNQDIRVRRFDAAGNPIADGVQVNDFTPGNQRSPAVDMNPSGAFVITWGSSQDGSGYGVFARQFDPAGDALATEFLVNTYVTDLQIYPSVGLDDQGNFVIAWESERDGEGFGIFARRFDSTGLGQATEFQVNTVTAMSQRQTDIDVDADGDFVVVWTSSHEPMYGVFGQRFSSAGSRSGSEFQLHTYVTGAQLDAHVGLDADGDFVAVWMSYLGDGNYQGVFGQRFSSSGTPTGEQFQVNQYVTGYQVQPDLTVDARGDFIVTWFDGFPGFSDIRVRRFRASGATTGDDFLVNTSTGGPRDQPAVAGGAHGGFAVAWQSSENGGDVLARSFEGLAPLDVDGDGTLDPLTDGLLVFRFFFGFTGEDLVDGAVGDDCTRCDAPAIIEYLQTFF